VSDEGLFQRWIKFNGVGALGIAVQLGVLALLVRNTGVHYLWATAVAVEAAVLHNFLWHERWTWRARRSGSGRQALARLTRFHLLNGAISLAGNVLLMRILAGSLQMDPLAANIIAIMICSIVNFAAGELLVFKRAAAVLALAIAVQPLHAAAPAEAPDTTPGTSDVLSVDLQQQTLQAWAAYEQAADGRLAAASATSAPFFAMDAFGVKDWRQTALANGIAMSRIERARPGAAAPAVPDGKIHHWAGAIFVPRTSVAAVLDRLSQLAGQESKHYEDVIGSKLLSRDGDRYRIYMKVRRAKVVTVTYNTEHAVEYRRLAPTRAAARSASVRIAELKDAGTPGEQEKPIGSDSGYLWRLNAYWRYEAVNGGVLIECESVSLSRSVPALLRPFVTGTVEGLARESLQRTLTGLRTYLTQPG
jgi:putative flippase GtrA